MEIDFTQGVSATSYGTGPFHPAIRNGNYVYYWPNITFDTEDDARHRALLSLSEALERTMDIIEDWNVWEAR